MKVWKPPAENLPNVIDRLKEGITFPLFFQLLSTTEYIDKLTEMVVTLFVPVEDTLDLIAPEELEEIKSALKDKDKAKKIIENHLIDEAISLREMLDIKELTTLSGRKIKVDVSCNIREDFEFSIENACFVKAEIENKEIETANLVCYNGFIHTIKGIIL
ncbi:MAG: hypothetical protein GXO21_01430 [Aquificae bacterium]|nr:hypothetical protein [Aquificota bacterium]